MALIQMGSVDEAVTALIVSVLSVNTEGGSSRGGDSLRGGRVCVPLQNIRRKALNFIRLDPHNKNLLICSV